MNCNAIDSYYYAVKLFGWQPLKRSVRDRMPQLVQEMNRHVVEG